MDWKNIYSKTNNYSNYPGVNELTTWYEFRVIQFTLCHVYCIISLVVADSMAPIDLTGYLQPQFALRWRQNGRDSVSNHQPHDCLLNRLFRRRSKKTSKLRVTGLCAGNSPGTDEFPAQMGSYAENVSIWWRHHGYWATDMRWQKRHNLLRIPFPFTQTAVNF